MKRYITGVILSVLAFAANAQQRFFNLTADEVRIDSVLPVFAHSFPLCGNYADSTYAVDIVYPEFITMSDADIRKYKKISNRELPTIPDIQTQTVVERKKGSLEVFFVPLVKRDGKYQKLVSFMLEVVAKGKHREARSKMLGAKAKVQGVSERYAAHSVLTSGKWAKIQVPSTGVYQITDELIRKAGFTDLSKIRVYGYGGNLQNETFTEADLVETDDLKEVKLCSVGGRRLFYAKGPVSWGSPTATIRTRNPYSDYGCYFITQGDTQTETTDSATFVNSFYPSADDYHSLHEVEEFAWFEGGRNLFQNDPINNGSSKTYTIATSGRDGSARITVCLTAGVTSAAKVSINDNPVGDFSLNISSSYEHGTSSVRTFTIDNAKAENTVTVTTTSGGPVRLDYISSQFTTPFPVAKLSSANIPVPEFVYNITNQDHHGDETVDMIIVIPTSQKLKA